MSERFNRPAGPQSHLRNFVLACLSAGLLCIGAVPLLNLPAFRFISPAASNAERPPMEEITTSSPMLDAVIQNTPGYSEGFAVGVPRSYEWCSGSYKPPETSVPHPDFTAVTGWGQIYAMTGSASYSNPAATIEIANARTYVRNKSTHQWMLVQQQAGNPLAGAYFVPDFSPKAVIPLQLSRLPNGTAVIGPPPADRNAHFWMLRRGTYPAGSIDGVYVQMDIKVGDPKMGLVANVGADWWRDATAEFVQGFANNPGAGMSNWIKLSTKWTTLRFYSLSTADLMANPPPPLATSVGAVRQFVTRRRAIAPAPCLLRSLQPLPKALVRLERR